MQQLQEHHGVPAVDNAVRFITLRLASRPECAPIHATTRDVWQRLRGADDKAKAAGDACIAMTAEIRYLDTLLDAPVKRLSRRLLALPDVDGKRKEELYAKLFTAAPSDMLRGVANAKQQNYVKNILERIAKEDAYAMLRDATPEIQTAFDNVEAALVRRKALLQEEDRAVTDLRHVLIEAREIYNACEPRLHLIFPNQSALVESFFMDLRRRPSAVPVAENVDADVVS